ncbi:MAG: hypothetical protein ISN26_01580 [Betaproteobacteria bacterium AqS2]|uniref:Uncharacterized protein n=1 Tax=Candidatus Amphirhobacter heronislandensis TaxID=1732024 RepID=A0A930UDV9_9GAMM|nr:hypothetical protein [Betaproteobacteria bacterium AqS2]
MMHQRELLGAGALQPREDAVDRGRRKAEPVHAGLDLDEDPRQARIELEQPRELVLAANREPQAVLLGEAQLLVRAAAAEHQHRPVPALPPQLGAVGQLEDAQAVHRGRDRRRDRRHAMPVAVGLDHREQAAAAGMLFQDAAVGGAGRRVHRHRRRRPHAARSMLSSASSSMSSTPAKR